MNYKRILLKLSGEALKGNNTKEVFDKEVLEKLVSIIKNIKKQNIDLGIVVGGGNIFRGRVSEDFNVDRIKADFVGMNATNINGLMLEEIFNVNGIKTICLSTLPLYKINEKYSAKKANEYLKQGYVVIFAGGTGKPLFSTDTAAALRAKDINADVILAGKHGTDGVYSDDPSKNPKAKKYDTITYNTFIRRNLNAMDVASIKICRRNNILVKVFNMDDLDNINKIVEGEHIGTTIGKE